MHCRKFLILMLLVNPAWAGVVEDVRSAVAQRSFATADSDLKTYVAKNGVTGEYVEAYSWLARAALSDGDYNQASAYAKQTKALALEQLKQRPQSVLFGPTIPPPGPGEGTDISMRAHQ